MSPGIYRTPTGWRVVACISRTQRREKRFPPKTPERTMRQWQQDACADLRRTPPPARGSLLHDIEHAYLPAIAGMPTKGSRTRYVRMWVEALGPGRDRSTVTPADIRAILERWRAAFSWEAGTCNRVRTALMHVYTVLNGKSGANPVRDVPKYRERVRPPKRLDYVTLEAILAAMPDTGQRRKGETPKTISQTKARLRVIAYTGLPHAQVMALLPEHILWAERAIYIPGRNKGEGTDDVWLPLAKAGLVALAGFADADAWGHFSTGAMRSSFKRAARRIGRPDLTPYDLRHVFGTAVLRYTKNRAATRDLMLHTTDATTARYAAAAIPVELRDAIAAFDREVVASRVGRFAVQADDSPASPSE